MPQALCSGNFAHIVCGTAILSLVLACSYFFFAKIKGALSGLRQFLAAQSPLKKMKNYFYFTSKALFVLKIFKFLS